MEGSALRGDVLKRLVEMLSLHESFEPSVEQGSRLSCKFRGRNFFKGGSL